MVKLSGMSLPTLRDLLLRTYGTNYLPSLTRPQWLSLNLALTELCRPLRRKALEPNDPPHGTASDDQWARICFLQIRLGWDDAHRDAYIKKHGHIDYLNWMTVPIARAIITGMEKTLKWKEENN